LLGLIRIFYKGEMEFVAKEIDGFIVVADNQSHMDNGLFHMEDTLSTLLCRILAPELRLEIAALQLIHN